jgi:signal transduction histidine kinase
MSSLIAVVLAVAVGVAAGAGTIAVIGGSVEPGVRGGNPGRDIDWVLPGSVPWQQGVRAGQTVSALRAADDPRGWSIETNSDGRRIVASLGPATAALRDAWPVAGAATLLAVAGLATWRRRPRWSVGASCLAAGMASVPLSIQADPVSSSYGSLLALVAPAVWIGLWMRRAAVRVAVASATAGLAASWLATRLAGLESFDALEVSRSAAVVVGTLSVVGALGAVMAARLRATAGGRRWLIDLAGLLVAVAVAGALLLADTPVPILLGAGVILAVAYPLVRRWATNLLDRLLLAGMRERMSIASAEAERARLARDLHDAPLQDLAGVIKRLELLPAARAESDALRDVAHQLRSVATQLYPPTLDDLGLVAAIEQSAERARETQPDIEVAVEVADRTGIRRRHRPPEAVELAAFRIVHEALSNALAHSGSRLVHVVGELTSTRIVLSLRDDGHGMPSVQIAAPSRPATSACCRCAAAPRQSEPSWRLARQPTARRSD